ncbi:MAG TPA: SMP-30/gluconolactonase/LRE family protein [Bryobacteraceae bacterium]|nr:SMP-30/gluconolactonase/LRE family protein [Bryobacteraceae bacterium]
MLQAKSEKFWDCIDRDAKVEQVATGFGFTEGPVFSRLNVLLFSDIPKNRIMKWERGNLSVFRENSNGANGLTLDHQGRLLVCEKGRVTRTEKNGTITVLAADGLQGPNDLVYSIDGSVYFTDLPQGRIYQITRERSGVGGVVSRGAVRVVADDCTGPNGVALSPNQQKLYVADSRTKIVHVYNIAPDGALKDGREFAQIRGDGLKTDESGNVWIADGEGVAVFTAQGEMLGMVKTPEQPSNLNWGAGFRGLYITARTSVYRVNTKSSGTRTF